MGTPSAAIPKTTIPLTANVNSSGISDVADADVRNEVQMIYYCLLAS
jgi:hypothetical protein